MNISAGGVTTDFPRRSSISDLDVAQDAARAGAKVVAAALDRPPKASFKGDADPVTETDHRSEVAILEILSRHRPDDPVVREEGGGNLPDRGRVWLVDPIDGTTNFLRGFPWMGVSVALWIDDAPAVGVVVDISNGNEYTAVAGDGAWLNGSPIGVSGVPDLGEALIVTGFPYDRSERTEICDTRFRRVLGTAQGIRRLGAASLDLCMVACGKLDGYWEEDLSPWDMGAGVLMVTEAGGKVTDQSGGAVKTTTPFVVASNGPIHDRFLETLEAT
ncbi:MAG: inositol monophosphatase family protein [bacterium]|nr:inositol monophosphatase [Acidimicrobiia bacterium]MCY4650503.1 inositol monophosphatase family protein [bacterium]